MLFNFVISSPPPFFHKELTLEQIRNSTVSNPDQFPHLLLPEDHVSGQTGCLIEEISSKEIQVEMKRPAYELKILTDQNEKPLKIELEVELPGINSVSLCDLSVSEVGWIDNTVNFYQSTFSILCCGNKLHNLSGLHNLLRLHVS